MSREFSLIRSKIRVFNIPGVMREFPGMISEGYRIRTLTFKETFYNVLDLSNEILVSVDPMKAGLTFSLDHFIILYFNAPGLTPIQLITNS